MIRFFLIASLLTTTLQSAEVKMISADVVIFGGTPGGIAMAVRAAREGLDVVLVNHNEHLGGVLSSGLGVWDTLWEGKRAPIYDEARQAIFDHYRRTYGEDSPQYRDALPGKSGHTNGKFEPKVAEKILTALVTQEKNIRVINTRVPQSVKRVGSLIQSVNFMSLWDNVEAIEVQAKVFADCSYEGDLAALAKVPYRVGREARSEFDEPHAGMIVMKMVGEATTPQIARAAELHHRLKLRKFDGFQHIEAQSTGAADGNVQAFNYRTILSSDPANRLPVEKPANYDPEKLRALEIKSRVEPNPNSKRGWNRPQLVGLQTAYVEGDWTARQRVTDAHWDATLALLYFLQNDPSVPDATRADWGPYGLAKDEFTDHGHRPHEIYAREARRITGRYIFTQHDAMLAAGIERAPVHADSIGITEWYLDSHACTPQRIPGALEEGKMMLDVETFPSQVPYRAILPQGVDNLLVPVCLSATHVAWGTIRLEPTWMHLCESAGYAAVLALQKKVTPADLDPELLLRKLAASHVMLNFFNDVDVASDDPRVAAAQYFGTKGFFADYDARLDAPLTEAVQTLWQKGFTGLQKGTLEPMRLLKAIHAEKAKVSPSTNQSRGAALLELWRTLNPP